MSSDAKDSGAVRQEPSSKATWGQQQSQSVSQEEPLAHVQSSAQQPAQQSHNNGYAANRSLPNDYNDDLAYYDEPYQSADASPDTTHSFLRRWSPVFIPLILAALTSLIVLPLIAARYARVLPENLWLIV